MIIRKYPNKANAVKAYCKACRASFIAEAGEYRRVFVFEKIMNGDAMFEEYCARCPFCEKRCYTSYEVRVDDNGNVHEIGEVNL